MPSKQYPDEEVIKLLEKLSGVLGKHHPVAGMEAMSILIAYYFLGICNDRDKAVSRIIEFAEITAKYAKGAPEKYVGWTDADREDIRVS